MYSSLLLASCLISTIITAPFSRLRGRNVIAPIEGREPTTVGPNEIHYNLGANVLTKDVNIYLIYYGNWTASQKALIEDFVSNVGNSSWYKLNHKYYYQAEVEAPKVYADGQVILAKTVDDFGSHGNVLKDYALPEIIQFQIDNGTLPIDESAIYFVLTAGDVAEIIRPDFGDASFCSAYCGYHVSWELTQGKRIYYSHVGLPAACPNGCVARQIRSKSPNNDTLVDAMLSTFAHELVEAVSDPYSDGVRAWEDDYGAENADKCAWTFGNIKDAAIGAWNVQVGSKKYLIQRNWDPEFQACALA